MAPLSLLAAQKLVAKLTNADCLAQQITAVTAGLDMTIPNILAEQIVLSPAPPDLADKSMQLSYPRICIYSSSVKNTQLEKFRSFSGQVALIAEIWASANLVTDADQWIHFYVGSLANILQSNTGDWNDGLFYSGGYDVQFYPPKAGGLGFVESAKLTLNLNASLS